MGNKKEIKIEKKDVRAILLIFLIPLLLTFLLEHLGEFSYTSHQGGPILDVKMNSLTFTTPFGNETTYDITGQGIGYDGFEDGGFVINSSYSGKFPYYVKAVFIDILYPFMLIIILFFIYFFKKKFFYKIILKTFV